jgi:hypothetical protein
LEKPIITEGFVAIECAEDERVAGHPQLYCIVIDDTIYFFDKQVVRSQPVRSLLEAFLVFPNPNSV